jgi:DNA-binding response OmpR family regulator
MNHKQMLIIEDDTALREGLEETFSEKGFMVDVASKIKPASLLFREKRYEVILCDLKFPGDGFNFIKKVLKSNTNMRIFIITGANLELLSKKEKNFLKMAEGVFAKPFKIKDLIEAVQP